MGTLNVASKASQATTLPALLVAHYAAHLAPNDALDINLEEAEMLVSDDKAVVELVSHGPKYIHGSEHIISTLMETHPSLDNRNKELVLVSCNLGCF